MCIRFIARECPTCRRKSIATLQQCKAKLKEVRRVQDACFLAFWVKEQQVCTMVDNTEGRLEKLCKECHKEDVLDTLMRHNLRKMKMARDREVDREQERLEEIERWRILEAQGYKREPIQRGEDGFPLPPPLSDQVWDEQAVRCTRWPGPRDGRGQDIAAQKGRL